MLGSISVVGGETKEEKDAAVERGERVVEILMLDFVPLLCEDGWTRIPVLVLVVLVGVGVGVVGVVGVGGGVLTVLVVLSFLFFLVLVLVLVWFCCFLGRRQCCRCWWRRWCWCWCWCCFRCCCYSRTLNKPKGERTCLFTRFLVDLRAFPRVHYRYPALPSSPPTSSVRGGEAILRRRGMIGSRSFCGKAPMRQFRGKPIAVSGSGYTGKQINSFNAVIHMQESPPHKRFSVGCSSPFLRLAEHLTALRAWCNVCPVGENPTCSVPAL